LGVFPVFCGGIHLQFLFQTEQSKIAILIRDVKEFQLRHHFLSTLISLEYEKSFLHILSVFSDFKEK